MRRTQQTTADRLLSAVASQQRPESCLFFTVHKCASTFVNRLLWVLTEGTGYELRDYESAVWKLRDHVNRGSSYQPVFEQSYDQLFRLRGEIYAPQRKPLDFPGRDRFKHIFFLRDPRDVLVSAYYSFGFTHALPVNPAARRELELSRAQIRAEGIDAYALRAADQWVLNVYRGYQQLRETSHRSLFLTYDEFRVDTGAFIDKIADFLQVRVPPEKHSKLVSDASPVQKHENVDSHRRSGRSGQYHTELKPETVAILNEKFADVLEYWADGRWLTAPNED